MVAQVCDYTKHHWIVDFKDVFYGSELHSNKAVIFF